MTEQAFPSRFPVETFVAIDAASLCPFLFVPCEESWDTSPTPASRNFNPLQMSYGIRPWLAARLTSELAALSELLLAAEPDAVRPDGTACSAVFRGRRVQIARFKSVGPDGAVVIVSDKKAYVEAEVPKCCIEAVERISQQRFTLARGSVVAIPKLRLLVPPDGLLRVEVLEINWMGGNLNGLFGEPAWVGSDRRLAAAADSVKALAWRTSQVASWGAVKGKREGTKSEEARHPGWGSYVFPNSPPKPSPADEKRLEDLESWGKNWRRAVPDRTDPRSMTAPTRQPKAVPSPAPPPAPDLSSDYGGLDIDDGAELERLFSLVDGAGESHQWSFGRTKNVSSF
ncbi:hypothetical protein DFJ74DRAFT_531977 [Hyaloraphidium curvatum]|nr:hypothetical protein DFJ74DRAFT_531977 [Hyaloraphidium curvatum]